VLGGVAFASSRNHCVFGGCKICSKTNTALPEVWPFSCQRAAKNSAVRSEPCPRGEQKGRSHRSRRAGKLVWVLLPSLRSGKSAATLGTCSDEVHCLLGHQVEIALRRGGHGSAGCAVHFVGRLAGFGASAWEYTPSAAACPGARLGRRTGEIFSWQAARSLRICNSNQMISLAPLGFVPHSICTVKAFPGRAF